MGATTNLHRYQYVSTLGSGGMATVVLAEDTVLGRKVALKRMKVADDERGVSRFRREALIGASVSHPNLVSIFDVVTAEDGDQVIVMEYVRGETLRDALFRETTLPVPVAMRILRGVGAALDAIHRQGIVHRDVKPANILLGADAGVKLADLGIASVPDRTRITTDGALLGTFSYMAPEQLGGEPATPAVDIYALAAVAFETLSGRKAHSEGNPVALAHAISTQPPPDLREFWPDAPAAAAEVLIRGMSTEPDRRPRSAEELTSGLHAALEPETTAPHPPPRREPPTRAAGAASRAAAAGAAAAGGAGAGGTSSTPVSRSLRSGAPAAPVAEPASDRSGAARHSGDPRQGLFAAGLVALVALAVLLAVLLNGGSSRAPQRAGASGSNRASTPTPHGTSTANRPQSKTSSTASRSSAGSGGASTSQTTASSGSATSPAATSAAGASNPVAAVESFYSLAASHRYAQAWALADRSFQSQLGGYSSFQRQQSGDRSITFNAARVVHQSSNAATVAVQTTSVRTDRTHHCSGTVDLTRGSSAATWMLHLIHINCT